jgi:hypothetical protein
VAPTRTMLSTSSRGGMCTGSVNCEATAAHIQLQERAGKPGELFGAERRDVEARECGGERVLADPRRVEDREAAQARRQAAQVVIVEDVAFDAAHASGQVRQVLGLGLVAEADTLQPGGQLPEASPFHLIAPQVELSQRGQHRESGKSAVGDVSVGDAQGGEVGQARAHVFQGPIARCDNIHSGQNVSRRERRPTRIGVTSGVGQVERAKADGRHGQQLVNQSGGAPQREGLKCCTLRQILDQVLTKLFRQADAGGHLSQANQERERERLHWRAKIAGVPMHAPCASS